MTEAPIIKADGLTRHFGPLTAVDHLSLEVSPGEIFGLVGPDGAGKTTVLRLLTGLVEPDAGSALVTGYDSARHPEKVKDNIGYMAQRFGLYPDLSVDENMDFYADLFGMSPAERRELLPRLLEMTRMAPFRGRLAGRLSGGMKQKLALMCTLLHKPRVLFLDEPTNGVDPVSRRDFWEILYQLVREGMTVLVTTAYLDEAERCHRVGLMHRGRLIRCDTPAAFRAGNEETCYKVRCPDQRAAKAHLDGRDGVASVEPFGADLHAFVRTARVAPEQLAAELSARGLGPAEFREVEPSLEDVFILLIKKASAGAA
ncbi:MAG: ABC transporter ATP-binding protein [Bryobacterales bacterium]|nr:ABC transporter ATP-binding protein [Bryobacterales bacterium]